MHRWVRVALGVALTVTGSVVRSAEAPHASPSPAPTPRSPFVVRTGVDLVQVDAVVVDKDGRYVTDLTIDDFEILQDGKRRPASYCEYVVAQPPEETAPREKRRPLPSEEAVPPTVVPVQREDVRRIMTFVVDDLNLSGEGLQAVTGGLRKVIREDLLPGDLMAIVRTSGGAGILQQLTSDRRVLEAAVADVASRPPGLGLTADEDADVLAGGGAGPEAATTTDRRYVLDRNAHFAEAALGTMGAVLENLRDLPGRKSMVVFTERMAITDLVLGSTDPEVPDMDTFEDADHRVAAAAIRVTDLANRASTVVYTVDPSGPLMLAMGADNNALGGRNRAPTGTTWQGQLNRTREERAQAESGLRLLAERTGGVFFGGESRVEAAVARIREDQKGYYLVGYVPDEATFKPASTPRFHKLELRVKRPGLRVRSRGAFSPVTDDAAAVRPPMTEQAALVQAMLSPFATQSIPIRVTPVFGYDAKAGYILRSYVHVAAAALAFTAGEGGGQRAKLKLVAGGIGGKGALPPIEREITIGVDADKFEAVKSAGMVLEFSVPIARPGPYQLRVAVRDAGSSQIGTATQFVDVPNLEKRRLAMSGVVLGSLAVRGASTTGDVAVVAAARLNPAIRRFAPGAEMSYAFAVYHPAVDKGTGHPKFTTRLRLVRQGKDALVQEIKPAVQRSLQAPARDPKAPVAKDTKPIPGVIVAGTFTLPAALEAGDYAVQLMVVDRLGKNEPWAAQWTSLQIAPEEPAAP